MVMVMRPKSKASLPSYDRLDVQPQQEQEDTRRAHARGKGSRFLASMLLRRVVAAIVVLASVLFILIWNHLFAIDVGSVLLESQGGSSIEETFTVR